MNINANLKRFNSWWDEFILQAIKPAAILSMGLGTVAVFSLQGLAINPWFVLSWAIVQAVSIDGLFFATWDRLFSHKLKKANALAIIGLTIIGLVLAAIAIAITAIVGFQVLWALADSQTAMARLGISPELFTYARAGLAVVVFVMMAYVRSRVVANEPVAISPEKANPRANRKATISPVVAVSEAKPLAIPEVAISHNDGLMDITGANSHSPKVVNQGLNSVDVVGAKSESKRELIKRQMAIAVVDGKLTVSLQAIALASGAGYSTVKLYAPDIKKELGVQE